MAPSNKGIRLDEIRGISSELASQDLNQLALVGLTKTQFENLNEITVPAASLNQIVSLLTDFQNHIAGSPFVQHASATVDGANIGDGTITEPKLGFSLVSQTMIDDLQVLIDAAELAIDQNRNDIDTLQTITLPGFSQGFLDDISDLLDHISQTEGAHQDSAIEYQWRRPVLDDVTLGSDQVRLNLIQGHFFEFRPGTPVVLYDDNTVATPHATTIDDWDRDTGVLTLADVVPFGLQASENTYIQNSVIRDVEAALEFLTNLAAIISIRVEQFELLRPAIVNQSLLINPAKVGVARTFIRADRPSNYTGVVRPLLQIAADVNSVGKLAGLSTDFIALIYYINRDDTLGFKVGEQDGNPALAVSSVEDASMVDTAMEVVTILAAGDGAGGLGSISLYEDRRPFLALSPQTNDLSFVPYMISYQQRGQFRDDKEFFDYEVFRAVENFEQNTTANVSANFTATNRVGPEGAISLAPATQFQTKNVIGSSFNFGKLILQTDFKGPLPLADLEADFSFDAVVWTPFSSSSFDGDSAIVFEHTVTPVTAQTELYFRFRDTRIAGPYYDMVGFYFACGEEVAPPGFSPNVLKKEYVITPTDVSNGYLPIPTNMPFFALDDAYNLVLHVGKDEIYDGVSDPVVTFDTGSRRVNYAGSAGDKVLFVALDELPGDIANYLEIENLKTLIIGGSGHIVSDGVTTFPARPILEFTGSPVVTDDAGNNKTIVDIQSFLPVPKRGTYVGTGADEFVSSHTNIDCTALLGDSISFANAVEMKKVLVIRDGAMAIMGIGFVYALSPNALKVIPGLLEDEVIEVVSLLG